MMSAEVEDLREYYITPAYLERMAQRCRSWSTNAIKKQIELFQKSIPDYPEVCEILESEIHRRNLNRLKNEIRKLNQKQLKQLLKKYKSTPDYTEIIQTWMEIQNGARHLTDRIKSDSAQIVASSRSK